MFRSLLAALSKKATPTLLALGEQLLRHYVGLGSKIWHGLTTEIDRLDHPLLVPALSNEAKHAAAVAWLRHALALPDQGMPRFFMRQDYEGRVIQAAVLIRRLQRWLHPAPDL
jgi:hypothetical protein